MNRLLITGTNSGCGKTTITCAILSALKSRGVMPTAYKCGPDYIDPMFHRAVSGVNAYTLDPFFLNGEELCAHLAAHTKQLAVIEGAMGYYDGIAATDEASAYTVARETDTPVILAVNAKGSGNSLGAVIEGFVRHKKNSNIRGVIFDDATEARYPDLMQIAEKAGIHASVHKDFRAYGYMPHKKEWSLPSRHLGLLTTDEIVGLQDMLFALGRQAEKTMDIDGILALAETATPLKQVTKPASSYCSKVRLAAAKDEAFCFRYEENMETLEMLGCEIVFFSPLKDQTLPVNINGLYLCGGYPELYAGLLSANRTMRESIRRAVEQGMPTIAEGGGFLYLHEELDGKPMCGVIPGLAFETEKLQRFGYVTLTARKDNLLCEAGERIRSREFHYWDSTCAGDGFIAQKAGRVFSYSCVNTSDSLYAGFPHLYFPANPAFAERFVERMNYYEPERPVDTNPACGRNSVQCLFRTP